MRIKDRVKEIDGLLERLVKQGVRQALDEDRVMDYYLAEKNADEEDIFADPKSGDKKGDKGTPAQAPARPEPAPPAGSEKQPAAEPKPTPEKKPEPEKREPVALASPEAVPALGDVSFDMITQRLNAIRSGYSMKDANISNELQHYFNDLTSPERLALWKFLNGISGILLGTTKGTDATEPDRPEQPGVTIHPTKGTEKKSDDGGHGAEKPAGGHEPQRQEPVRRTPTGVEDTMAPIRVVRRKK